MYKKALVPVVLCLSALLFATTTGYFMASSGYQTIPAVSPANPGCGPSFSCDPGPAVVMASQAVPKGSYVLTARVDGESYLPNSGATCFFTGGGTDSFLGVTNPPEVLDTSSNGTVLAKVTQTWVASATPTKDTTISLVCQRGYQFESSSLMKGAATIVKVKD